MPVPASPVGEQRLVGRDDELALLHELLDGQVPGPGLLLLGDAGLGKSVLVSVAVREMRARGHIVLTASGSELETDLAYAHLHQLLTGVHPVVEQLAAGHREALEAALGTGTATVVGRARIAEAVLVLLQRLARRTPVLVVLDDLHWLDSATAHVLDDVSRSLPPRVTVLAARRPDVASFYDDSRLLARTLGPLPRDAAAEIVRCELTDPDMPLLEQVLDQAEGNPLAVVELARAASVGAWAMTDGELPSSRLAGLYSRRVAGLRRDTRAFLGILALVREGDVDLGCARTVLRQDPRVVEGLEAGLLTITDRGIPGFAHPLIGSTVRRELTAEEQRKGHLQLAECDSIRVDARVWHLAEATLGRDDVLSERLSALAREARRRGDIGGALSALVRAAALASSPDGRRRRLAEAAFTVSRGSGGVDVSEDLLAEAERTAGDTTSVHAAAAAALNLFATEGDAANAHRLLADSLADRLDSGGTAEQEVVDGLRSLLDLTLSYADETTLRRYESLLAQAGDAVPELLRVIAALSVAPLRHHRAALPALERQLARLDGVGDPLTPSELVSLAMAAEYAHRLEVCLPALHTQMAEALASESVGIALPTAMYIATQHFWTGRWDDVMAVAEDVLGECERLGLGDAAWFLKLLRAHVLAGRGDLEEAVEIYRNLLVWASPRRINAARLFAWHGRCVAALGAGHAEEAYRAAVTITTPGLLPAYGTLPLRTGLDLVEAAVATGRLGEARRHAAALDEAGLADLAPRFAMLVLAARAVVAPDASEARGLFDAALATPECGLWRFEQARIRLLFGERLRRDRDAVGAREQLALALTLFEAMGAVPWAGRARRELDAAQPLTVSRGLAAALTPQEANVVLLAAEGLSNREIAQRLRISHRTVGIHLYRAYPKLGIRSRSGLRHALDLAARPDSVAG